VWADAAASLALALLAVQTVLLAVFSFFAFFNYLYGIASLRQRPIARVAPSGRRIGVVVVAFNEGEVLDGTLAACDALSYANKVTVLADDSTDPTIVDKLRRLARTRGCIELEHHPFRQETVDAAGRRNDFWIEIWESPDFVWFHRPVNVGFKAGSLVKVQQYLLTRGIDLMYLLDADWHPPTDALERTTEVLEAQPDIAYVQTQRLSFPEGMNLFQKYVTIVEEGCYYVDFVGRQTLGHPVLFSGCCTLFRLDAVARVGGFTPGHLTEDLDISIRLWLEGWRGVYLDSVVNHGEVPFTYDHYRRQQERWACGSARTLKAFWRAILATPRLGWVDKMSALRQTAYFTSSLLTAVTLLIAISTFAWLAAGWNSYATEVYLYAFEVIRVPFLALVIWCLVSNIVEPVIMIVCKKRAPRDLLHLPMMIWYAWGVIPTYVLGNLKGLFGLRLDWFCTPKPLRGQSGRFAPTSAASRIAHFAMLAAALGFYFSEAWIFGWFDWFALLFVPAFVLAAVRWRD
jgi:cellulose synthase/poly-beta-1,6-N-acetylglucosamine synthase-like glycosyltransferase